MGEALQRLLAAGARATHPAARPTPRKNVRRREGRVERKFAAEGKPPGAHCRQGRQDGQTADLTQDEGAGVGKETVWWSGRWSW